MNYDTASDFDINQAVAKALGYLVKTEIEDGLCGFTKAYHAKYPDTIWAAETDESGEQCAAWEQINFCSSPENAWPIIVENKISIVTTDEKLDKWIAAVYSSTDPYYCYPEYEHENPLRAAMIVFLKLKEQ